MDIRRANTFLNGSEPRTLLDRVRFHSARWGLLAAVAVLTHLGFPAPASLSTPPVELEAAAGREIIAPFPFAVLKSDEEIAREGDARANTIRPVYRFSPTSGDSALAAMRTFFARLETGRTDAQQELASTGTGPRVRIHADEAAYLTDGAQREELQGLLSGYLTAMLARGVADAGVMRAEPSPLVSLRRGDSERIVPRDSLLTFADLMSRAEEVDPGPSTELGRRLFRKLTAAFYRPTVVPDQELSANRRDQARLEIDSVKYQVAAGERLVAAGEPISPEARDKILALRAELQRRGLDGFVSRTVAGPLLYNAIILSTFWLLLLLYRRESYNEIREVAFFAALFGLVVLLSAVLSRLFPDRPELLPIPFAAILITMLYNGRLALYAAVTLAILLGGQWVLRENNTLFFGLVGGVSAALGMRAVRRRHQLYVTIAAVAGAYTLAAFTLALTLGWALDAVVSSVLAGAVLALGSASVAMLLMPVAEAGTRITSDITLLELSDISRPLLQRLANEAPGTFAHSLAMANLCEAACSAIGANGLLARVGCYYHDIGKLKNPLFFVENQSRGANPHDDLQPEESAQIIRSHVPDGLALADEAKLPPVVRAFIPEHHGTSDIKYFLHRARGRAPSVAIHIEDFCYPGPRPQSVETAVAMLADSAEAAVRVLEDPTPPAVAQAIDYLVNQKLAAGQLDEAPLTLRNLDRIKAEFARVMAGVYHNRIEYPRTSGGITPEFHAVQRE